MGSKVSNLGKVATAAFLMAFAGPYKDVIRTEAEIQGKIIQLEALGIKGDVLKHIVEQARAGGYTTAESNSVVTLRILDDYINAARQTERAALKVMLHRLTS
jgi:hypothetical protein